MKTRLTGICLWIFVLMAMKAPAQRVEVVYNGVSVIGYASDNLPLSTSWTVEKRDRGQVTTIVAYRPLQSVEEMKANLQGVPALFRHAPYSSEAHFVQALFEAYQGAVTLGDMPMNHLPWVQFALGLGFEDRTYTPGNTFTYELKDANNRVVQTVELSHAAVPEPLAVRPVLATKPGYGVGEAAMSWRIPRDQMSNILSFSIFRAERGVESEMGEVEALGGVNVIGDSLYFNVRDTTLTRPGIYTYAIRTYNRFGIMGLPSETVDIYYMDSDVEPFVNYLEATGLDDVPAIEIRWQVFMANELNSLILEKSAYPDGPYRSLTVLSPRDTIYRDFIQQPMEAYYYRLIPIDRFGRSLAPSVIAPAISTFPFRVMPPVLQNITGIEGGVALEWEAANPEARGYYVFRKEPGPAREWQQVSPFLPYDGVAHTMQYTDTTALLGHIRYEYAVHAESMAYILSAPSNIRAARPLIEVPATPVTGLQLRKPDDDRYMLTWEDIMALDPYLAYYQLGTRRDSLGPIEWQELPRIEPNENFLFLDRMIPGVGYTIRAVNLFGYAGSHALPVYLPEYYQVVRGPEYLMGFVQPGMIIQLRWNPVEQRGLKEYRLYVVSEDGQFDLRQVVAPDRNSVELEWPVPGITLWTITAAYDDGSESEPSEVVMLEVLED